MGNIIILDENTANKIAAGEVIERPASVVKESVENSIDAGATKITVEIENGGVSYMRITDNGSGIQKDDVRMAFERHGTSKIRSSDDIRTIVTMGFRGEALASIAAVADVTLTSANKADPGGSMIRVRGGKILEHGDAGCPIGTVLTVKDLFFNTPARFKFLKSNSTESRYINDILTRIALARPDISFTLTDSGKEVFRTPGDNNGKSAIYATYGKEITDAIVEVNYKDEYAKVTGYCGKAEIASGNRNRQSFFVNNRYVKSKVFTSALEQAYKTLLMKNRYPFAVLYLDINYELVDVNVHPAKTEVRFSDEQALFRTIYHAVSNALMSGTRSYTGYTDISEIVHREKKREPEVPKRQSVITPSENDRKTPWTDTEAPKTIQPTEPLKKIEPKKVEPKPENIDMRQKIESLSGKPKTGEDCAEFVIQEELPENPPKAVDPPELTGIQALAFGYKIIGSPFDTYIIIQQGDNLYIIDQHAAHEKTIYEKLISLIREGGKAATQILLNPQTVDLADNDMNIVEAYKSELNTAGYIFDDFGDNTLLLREIPYAAGDVPPKELFIDAINILEKSKGTNNPAVKEELVYDMACKAAIKANKRLTEPEITALVSGLIKLQNPDTCPHGRPVYITMNKKDFEKMFKRIL